MYTSRNYESLAPDTVLSYISLFVQWTQSQGDGLFQSNKFTPQWFATIVWERSRSWSFSLLATCCQTCWIVSTSVKSFRFHRSKFLRSYSYCHYPASERSEDFEGRTIRYLFYSVYPSIVWWDHVRDACSLLCFYSNLVMTWISFVFSSM